MTCWCVQMKVEEMAATATHQYAWMFKTTETLISYHVPYQWKPVPWLWKSFHPLCHCCIQVLSHSFSSTPSCLHSSFHLSSTSPLWLFSTHHQVISTYVILLWLTFCIFCGTCCMPPFLQVFFRHLRRAWTYLLFCFVCFPVSGSDIEQSYCHRSWQFTHVLMSTIPSHHNVVFILSKNVLHWHFHYPSSDRTGAHWYTDM